MSNYPKNTSWNRVAPWYNKLTSDGGHYFHQHVIIPNSLKLLKLDNNSNLLDLACGNGILANYLPKGVKYTGIDMAENLIKEARYEDKNYSHKYIVADITKPLTISEDFTHATIILALQNVNNPEAVFKNASKLLTVDGRLLAVINHPMFRIPRQTSWGIDENRKIQYRRIDRYITPLEIPVNMNPSDRNSEITISYHYPLSTYIGYLSNAGFLIENVEEWTSDKQSQGSAKKMEDRARSEIPLFMAIVARKI